MSEELYHAIADRDEARRQLALMTETADAFRAVIEHKSAQLEEAACV